MGYQPSPNELLGFHIAEGFVRITCDGHTDVYLVLNRVPLGANALSVAYAMDDFGDDMNGIGLNFFVKETDEIKHLGEARDYFLPISTVEPWKTAVVRLFEQSIELLPIVRACEELRTFGRAPTVE